MANPQNNLQIPNEDRIAFSANDLIKDAQRIREFRGDGSYALTSFLREVDTILPLLNQSEELRNYIVNRVLLNKIQGPALDVLRTLGPAPTWNVVKTALTQNFGVKQTYHQLYHQALSARNNGVSEYFIKLRHILSRLNEKYEYDTARPIEFSPNVNESIILRTFLDNIDPSLSSVVISRNIQTLREAYDILENSGLIRERRNTSSQNHNHKNHFNKNKNFTPNHNSSHESKDERTQRNHHQNNPSHSFNRQEHSGTFRQNYSNNHYNFQRRDNSGTFRQNNSNSSNQFRRNQPEPMDVDHVQHDVNFQCISHKFIYR